MNNTKQIKTPIKLIVLFGLFIGQVWSQNFAATVSNLRAAGQGDDSQARIDMRTLTNTAMATGGASRTSHEQALVAELAKNHVNDIKLFLIREVRNIGYSTATGDALGRFLNDATLSGDAIDALLSMAIESFDKDNGVLYNDVRADVRAKLTGATGDNKTALIRAAASLADYTLVDTFIAEAGSANTDLKWAALRGLAVTGDPKSQTTLAAAMNTNNSFYLSQAVNLNLIYARRLAERGNKTLAGTVTTAIQNQPGAQDCDYYVISAKTNTAEIPTIGPADTWYLPSLTPIRPKNLVQQQFEVYGFSQMKRLRIKILVNKVHQINITDLKGRVVWSNKQQSQNYVVNNLGKGSYLINVKVAGKVQPSRKVTLY